MNDIMEEISRDCYKRVDAEHPIDWRYNDCTPPTKLVLKTNKKPPEFAETGGVRVAVIKQDNNQYATVFVLNDELCADTFKVFCEDVIESSRDINPSEVTDFVFERYVKWLHLFKPCFGDKLSNEEIRGLVGELYVLKSKFIPVFGATTALHSWTKRFSGKQDFIEHDKWYEVKTLLEGNNSIRISSLEQLSRTDTGEIILVNIRRTTSESSKHITLNTLYADIIDMLPTFALKKQFAETMLLGGFVVDDPYYDERCYEVINVIGYDVVDNFPKLTPSNLPCGGILRAEYEISVGAMKEFEVEKWN